MVFDGVFGDRRRCGDGLIAAPVRDVLSNFALTETPLSSNQSFSLATIDDAL